MVLDVDIICKLAQEFEDALPPTLRAGVSKYQDNQPNIKQLISRELSVNDVKSMMHKFNHILTLCRGAGNVLSTMKKDIILNAKIGVDSYVFHIDNQLKEIDKIMKGNISDI